MPTRAPADLSPAGRLRLPGRARALRLLTVTGLLVTAAAVVHTGAGQPPTTPAGADPPPAGVDSPREAGGGTPSQGGETTPQSDGGQPVDRPGSGPDPGHGTGSGPDPGHGTGSGADTGAARLPVPDGLVGVPVRLGDPAGLALLHPGDHVDLLAVPSPGQAEVIAPAVWVLAVDRPGAALLLALTPEQGEAVVAAAPETPFAVILRH